MRDVSIVVPVKNEERSVQSLIDSICRQTRLPAEVIFVDGGSTDATRDIIKANIALAPFKIALVETDKAYPGEGRNIGIRNSGYDLIAFTDGGIVLDEKWLEELVAPMETDRSVDAVYGAYEPIVDSFLKECSLIAYISPGEKINGRIFRTNFIASSLFKKKICEKAGLFPPFRAAEDRIFMDNVKRSGARIVYTDKAIVRWQIPGSIRGIFNRFCEFSMHDILAGRGRDWHYSVARTYAILLFLLVMAVFVNKLFLFGILALLAVRVAHMFFKRKNDFGIRLAADPRYLFTIIFIILVTDLALGCGSVKYLLKYNERHAKT